MPALKVSAFKSQLCPACRRINDDYPAGELILNGSFLSEHRKEIIARIRHVEEAERHEHPLNRIIEITEHDDGVTITTTDLHLPHRIAHALQDAFGGTMKTHYDRDGYFTRVLWERLD
jgi:NMD protein affecting ribosome stability and mRNA decay